MCYKGHTVEEVMGPSLKSHRNQWGSLKIVKTWGLRAISGCLLMFSIQTAWRDVGYLLPFVSLHKEVLLRYWVSAVKIDLDVRRNLLAWDSAALRCPPSECTRFLSVVSGCH